MPYTERHFQRTEKLLQKTFLMDYLLQKMTTISGQSVEEVSMSEASVQPVNKKQKV